MPASDCIFCKIIAGKIPSKKIFEDSKVIGILDINPISEGHTLVIPKKHYETIDGVPDGEMGAIFGAVKKVVLKLRAKLEPDGFNVIQNNNEAAGQAIPHFHIHVIPRKEGDDLFALNPGQPASDEQLDELVQKLED